MREMEDKAAMPQSFDWPLNATALPCVAKFVACAAPQKAAICARAASVLSAEAG